MCQLDTVCLNSTVVGRYNYIYMYDESLQVDTIATHNYCISALCDIMCMPIECEPRFDVKSSCEYSIVVSVSLPPLQLH